MLLLSAMLLSACSRVTDTTETELQSEQEGNLDDFLLISDEYALIRPDGGNENILDIFKIIHGELTNLLGSTYPYGTDFVERGESIPQDNKEILLTKNTGVLFCPGEPQIYHEAEGCLCYWIHFSGYEIPALLERMGITKPVFKINDTDGIRVLFGKML